MEGPLLAVKAWAFSLLCVWLYRRFFQRIGPRDPEFEAWCGARPLLIKITCDPSALDAARRAIEHALGRRRRAVPASAGWPWTIHALELEVIARGSELHVRARTASVLRSGERPPPIADLLRAAASESGSVLEVWLHPRLHVDVTGRVVAPRGWRLRVEPGAARLPRPVAWESELVNYSQAPAGAQPPAMQFSL
jgi:hypothetical protein